MEIFQTAESEEFLHALGQVGVAHLSSFHMLEKGSLNRLEWSRFSEY